MLSRTGWSGELGFELYLCDSTRGEALWNRVMEAGARHDIAPIAPNTIRSIEGGLLSYVSDIDRNDNPYELGLDRLVDLNKPGGFLGQESLRRVAAQGPKRKLVGIEVEGDPIAGNEEFWPVLSDGQTVGRVTRCVFSPRLGRNIGFAKVPVEHSDVGSELIVVTPLDNFQARTCSWPWMRAEKNLPDRITAY